MSTLTEIRDAIKTTIETAIPALKVYPTIPDSVTLPAVVGMPDEVDFSVAMGRGTDTYEFDLIVLVSTGDMDVAQRQLDGFVTGAGSSSVRQAIFKARTLGLADVDAHVSAMTGYDLSSSVSSMDHVAAMLRLVVHTRGVD